MPSGWSSTVDTSDSLADGTDLARSLQFVPGIYVRRQSSFGQPAFATVRGSNARQVSVSLDGQRLTTPFGPGFDLGTFATAGITSIEVHRGGPGVFRGSGALSGALNLQTKTRKEPGWSTQATTLGGSWQTLGVSGAADLATKRTAASLNAEYWQSEGDFDFVDDQGTSQTRINNDSQSVAALGTVEHRFNRASRVKATVNYQRSGRGIAGPAEFQNTFDEARLDEERVFGTLRLDQRDVIDTESFILDLNQHGGAQAKFVDYANPNTVLGSGEFASRTNFLSVSGGAGALGFVPAIDSILQLDLDVRYEDLLVDERGPNANQIVTDRTTLGGALSEELMLLDERVRLNAGVRIESVQGEFEDVGVLPAAGAIVAPIEWLSFKANVARTFRAPDFDELYLNIESLRGNPDLDSERAVVWDAGVIVGSEDYNLETAYFEGHVSSSIEFVPVSSFVIEATNLRGVTNRGVEALANARPLKPLVFTAGYTFTHSRAEELPNVQTPNQPEHRGFARAEWQILSGFKAVRLLSINVQTTGQTQTNLDRFGNLTNPAYAMVDAGLAYKPVDWAKLSFNAYNLGDERSVVDGLQRPLPGRSFYGSLTLMAGQ